MLLHCNRMTRFRDRKKAEQERLLEERRRLEQELSRKTDVLKVHGGSGPYTETQRLVLEREALREESIALRQQLAGYQKYLRVVRTASTKLIPNVAVDVERMPNVIARCISSVWQPVQEQAGWRVYFPRGEPSFFFYPFSRQEFDAGLAAQPTADLTLAGTFLGWDVHHAALAKTQTDQLPIVGRVRFSKRLRCSVESIQNAIQREDGSNEWPVLATARNLGLVEDIHLLTLQQFDEHSRVIVRSYPGETNYRYLAVSQCAKWGEDEGERVLKYSFVITDSAANSRSHDAEDTLPNNVYWVKDGGCILTLTEVDDTATDVAFEHWGPCKDDRQAQSHFVTFGQIVTRWEQLVAPGKALML